MRNTFKYTVFYLTRERDILIWALAFPIILSTLFSFMFAGLDEAVYATDLGLVVVEDEAWEADEAVVLREVISAVSEPGTAADEVGSLVVPQYVEDEQAAERILAETDAIAYLTVDAQGVPHLHMKLDPSNAMLTSQQTVLKTVLDGAQRTEAAVSGAVEKRIRTDVERAVLEGGFAFGTFDSAAPQAAGSGALSAANPAAPSASDPAASQAASSEASQAFDPAASQAASSEASQASDPAAQTSPDLEALPAFVKDYAQGDSLSPEDVPAATALLSSMNIDVEALVDQALEVADSTLTERVSITSNAPVESERYYYALLGMATLFTASIGVVAVSRTLANTSSLGARRTLGATSRGRVMTATCAAVWMLSFLCLLVAYLYMRFVLGVTFGGKDVACVLALAVSSLTGCTLGAFVGAIPGIPEGGKGGIVTCIACFGSLFAGLYGQACMTLADQVAAAAPWSVYVNPASLIARTFYSLYYYDSMVPYAESLVPLLVMAAVFLAGTALLARRQQHEHI